VPARAVVGRDAELAVVEEFLALASDATCTLVIEGEPGIGKTTLWQEAVRRADERGMRVLSSRPGPSETRLTFVGLGDFLTAVDADILGELPAPLERALAVALLRSDPKGPAPAQRAVATAFLSALRLLSRASPVVVAVDDLQWLDASSKRVLEFAMRRLASEPVGFLGTVRLDGFSERTVAQEWVRRTRLRPLTLAALHEILTDELGRTFPRPTLVRIERTSSGNPFFALELARALVERGEPLRGSGPLPVPDDLMELIAGRLRRLSASTRAALLVAAALPQPTLDELDRDAIERAEDAGVVRVDPQSRVHFTHPLLAMSVYGSATESARRSVHGELAQHVVDPEERARHLALAAEVPDEAVARALADAAQAARDRGAADAAIELLELACDLTPSDREDAVYPRRLELGRYLAEAGDPERAGSVLRDVAENAQPSSLRARALLLLAFGSETSSAGEAATDLCELALGQAGDDVDLRTEILAAASRMYDFDVEKKVSYAQKAMELAERRGASPQLRAYALLAFAEAEFFAGRGLAHEAFDRAAELESEAASAGGLRPARATHRVHHYSDIRPSARLLGILRIYADELDAARDEFEAEREVALEHGDEVQLGRTLIRLAVIELRAGHWDLADRHLHETSSVLERTKQDALRRWMLATSASLQTVRGNVDDARGAGEDALALATEAGAHWQIGECHAALGLLELSLDDVAAAAVHFDRASAINDHIGPEEPRLLRFRADRIETLVALGELDRAASALGRLEQQGQATRSAWALATAARCRGLVCSAAGDLDGAARSLERALVEHERLPIPFELGRTLLAKGRVHRRRNERRLAKDMLARSVAVFERLGSPLWSEKAYTEMRRLGLRRGATDELTPTEETVASLAASGLRNREIAERIFISPKTVEANLSRVYRKLGIHSRAELGARMAERERVTKT
jgi:DNA-binding CsgD family transcriptional regulator